MVEKLRSCEGLNDERSLSVIRGGRRRIRFNDRRHWITPAGRLQMLQSLAAAAAAAVAFSLRIRILFCASVATDPATGHI